MLHHAPTPRLGEYLSAALIVLLAATLRLSDPGITEFKFDEAILSRLALDMAQGDGVPLLGVVSSVGIPNTPINAYLIALPYLIGDNPIIATLFVGACNILAVALTWKLTRRYYGLRAATIAALLYSTGPWAVIYSRKIWAQDLLPPFVVASVLTGLLGFMEGKKWAQVAHWPLLAITAQIHYAGFTLIPLSLLMLVLGRKNVRKALIGGALLAALTFLPFIAGLSRAGLLSVEAARGMLGQNTPHTATLEPTALHYAWLTVAGTQIHALTGPEQFRNYLNTVPNAYPLLQVIPIGAAATAAWMVARAIRGRKWGTSADLVLVIWLLLPVATFTYTWTAVEPHYLIPLMPAAYVLVGAGLDALFRTPRHTGIRRGLTAVGLAALAVMAGLQVVLITQLIHFVDGTATPGGFGTPVHYLLDAREAILAQKPGDVIVTSEGMSTAFDREPAVWSILLDSVPDVRFVNGRDTVVIPAGNALELALRSGGVEAGPAGAYWLRPGTEGIFPKRPGEPDYVLYQPEPAILDDLITPISELRYANGAFLTGYAVGEGSVLTRWRLSGPVPNTYQAAVHVLDAEGVRLGQADRVSWPGTYWRPGDRLYLWFVVDVPPEAATLFVVMYTLDEGGFTNVEVVDANGAPLGQGVELPVPER